MEGSEAEKGVGRTVLPKVEMLGLCNNPRLCLCRNVDQKPRDPAAYVACGVRRIVTTGNSGFFRTRSADKIGTP